MALIASFLAAGWPNMELTGTWADGPNNRADEQLNVDPTEHAIWVIQALGNRNMRETCKYVKSNANASFLNTRSPFFLPIAKKNTKRCPGCSGLCIRCADKL